MAYDADSEPPVLPQTGSGAIKIENQIYDTVSENEEQKLAKSNSGGNKQIKTSGSNTMLSAGNKSPSHTQIIRTDPTEKDLKTHGSQKRIAYKVISSPRGTMESFQEKLKKTRSKSKLREGTSMDES